MDYSQRPPLLSSLPQSDEPEPGRLVYCALPLDSESIFTLEMLFIMPSVAKAMVSAAGVIYCFSFECRLLRIKITHKIIKLIGECARYSHSLMGTNVPREGKDNKIGVIGLCRR